MAVAIQGYHDPDLILRPSTDQPHAYPPTHPPKSPKPRRIRHFKREERHRTEFDNRLTAAVLLEAGEADKPPARSELAELTGWVAFVQYDGPMSHPGKILRRFREMWGLSIRDVEEKSGLIAQHWGDKAYFIDSTYFNKIETGQQSMLNVSMGKAVSMMEILNKGSGTLLRICRPPRGHILVEDFLGGPDRTRTIEEGRLAEGMTQLLSAADLHLSIPENTTLKSLPDVYDIQVPHPFQNRKRYLRVIVGKSDLCLYPYVLPGTLLIVDREYRRIPPDKEFDNEFQRPIFLVNTHDGYFCCWCELIENSDMVRIVQFPTGKLPFSSLHHPLKLGDQIEIVGAVAYEGIDRRRYLGF